MQQPWLSVIIPTYNGERYLSDALASMVLQGDLSDVECIVVDDDSNDRTLSIVKEFSGKISITVLKKQGNKGWVASSNQALHYAAGQYVCFLHQDDVWLENRLDIFRSITKQYADLDFFISPARFIDGDGRDVGAWHAPLQALPQKISNLAITEKLLIQNFIAIPSPLFKKAAAIQCGGLDEALWYTADWDFWLKLVRNFRVGYVDNATTAFRVHTTSQTLAGSKSLDEFKSQIDTVFFRHSRDLPCSRANIKAAQFSIMVNVALAAGVHGHHRIFLKLIMPFLKLGWRGWALYFFNSRILERVSARMRAGLDRKSDDGKDTYKVFQFVKFVLVGGLCVILNIVGLYVLTGIFNLHYLVSSAILGVSVNFVAFTLNKKFTFLSGDRNTASVMQFTKYNGVSIVSFCMVLILMYILVDGIGMWYITANVLVSLVMAFVNFYLHKNITYR